MKLANIAYLLALGIALSLSSTGCKRLDKTTPIPGRQASVVKETPPAEIRTGGASSPTDGGRSTTPPDRGNPVGDNTGAGTAIPTSTNIGDGSNKNPAPVTDPTKDIAPTDRGDLSTWNADPGVFKDQTVYFDFDKSVVKPSEVLKLQEVARRMKAEFSGPNKGLRIEGHCDERGTEDYNRALGDRRATSIRQVLAAEGVDASMIQTITFGEERPAVPGHNEAAWSKNRRGEILLLTRPGTN